MSQSLDQKPMRSLPTNHVIGVIDQLQEAERGNHFPTSAPEPITHLSVPSFDKELAKETASALFPLSSRKNIYKFNLI